MSRGDFLELIAVGTTWMRRAAVPLMWVALVLAGIPGIVAPEPANLIDRLALTLGLIALSLSKLHTVLLESELSRRE